MKCKVFALPRKLTEIVLVNPARPRRNLLLSGRETPIPNGRIGPEAHVPTCPKAFSNFSRTGQFRSGVSIRSPRLRAFTPHLPPSFRVSGTFRDPADFTVAVLYDADNFYEHPYIKYMPDFNFVGLTLNFDLSYSDGMQPIDSPKYNWIDWATLDCILENGDSAKIRLWDNATLVDAQFPAASVTCNVITTDDGIQAFDRLTLWYQNLAFDYIVPVGKGSVEYAFYVQGTGKIHSITIDTTIYAYTEVGGEESKDIANALVRKISDANDPYVSVRRLAVTLTRCCSRYEKPTMDWRYRSVIATQPMGVLTTPCDLLRPLTQRHKL